MTRSHAFIILLCFLFVSLLGVLADKPFSTRGEPREALVAQAMLNSGNYILAEGYAGAVPSKPPFLQWMVVAAAKVSGRLDEVSARLPSAFGAFVFALVFFGFLLRRTDPAVALMSCLILLTSFEWFRASLACRVDML
ncbi:MAG: glycosyltransferase family 39 protein, partial [Oligoflexia bacterium]|nr:glycosyltransferase family 39 protein [Oligoflexia bacterium]